MTSYERRNKRRNLLHDGKLFQPQMVEQMVEQKPKEKGEAIFQESKITEHKLYCDALHTISKPVCAPS